jgi:hypothetical protein
MLLGAELEVLRRGGLERTLRGVFGYDPSNLQVAIARAADGKPIGDALDDDQIRKYFGCDRSKLGVSRPLLVVIVAGIRSGKSLLVSVASVVGAMTADASRLKPHLIPKVRIVCPKAENALETFRHILGAIQESPALRSRLHGEPRMSPHPALVLRRFDRRLVEISIGVADSGGLSMRSGNLAGFVLDEAALFGEASTGAAVNAEGILHAAETRLLPGGQGWVVSSPFGPQGLLYKLYSDHWGKPSHVLVVRAPTLEMNPHFSRELVEQIRRDSPDVASREYDAEWTDADTAFLEGLLVDAAARVDPVDRPPQAGSRYIATMDPATRGNGWTLGVFRATQAMGERIARVELSCTREWIGTKQRPLDPSAVFEEMRHVLEPYGISTINCDAYGTDFITANAKTAGFRLNQHSLTPQQKLDAGRSVGALLRQSRIELSPVPEVLRDLKAVRRKSTGGAVTIHLPLTSDGRHCDWWPTVSLGVWLLSGQNFANDMAAAMKNIDDAGGVEAFFGEPG